MYDLQWVELHKLRNKYNWKRRAVNSHFWWCYCLSNYWYWTDLIVYSWRYYAVERYKVTQYAWSLGNIGLELRFSLAVRGSMGNFKSIANKISDFGFRKKPAYRGRNRDGNKQWIHSKAQRDEQFESSRNWSVVSFSTSHWSYTKNLKTKSTSYHRRTASMLARFIRLPSFRFCTCF